MTRSMSRSKWLAATAAGLIATMQAAWADEAAGRAEDQQDGAVGTSYGSADIVVTARRVEERLQDVPISITVFSQQQITRQNIANTNDLAIRTPGLSTSNPTGNAQATFSLRGFNQENSTAPTVGVFFADVVAPRGATIQSSVGDGAGPGQFFDLQNVQVLKGPQGTLFGRNTTGGAILLVPQKPTGNFEGYVEGSYGNYDMYRLQGVINVPLGDTARLRLGLDRRKRDGYVVNNTGIGADRFNDTDYYAFRGSLVVDLTPELENYTIVSYTRSRETGESNSLIGVDATTVGPIGNFLFTTMANAQLARYPDRGFYSTESTQLNPRSNLDVWQIINTTTWRASDNLTIKNIASYGELLYAQSNTVAATALDLSTFNGFPGFPVYPQGTYVKLFESNPRYLGHQGAQSTFTEEIQLQGSGFGNRLTYQTGFYFEDSQPMGESGSVSANLAVCPREDVLICSNPLFGNGSVGQNAQVKTIRSVGLYGQASYDITEQLKFTAGLRYTWDKQRATSRLINFKVPFDPADPTASYVVNTDIVDLTGPLDANPTFAATCVFPPYAGGTGTAANGCRETSKQSSSAPTWVVGLDYKPTEDILVYAKWARGYRTGGIQQQVPPVVRVYDPEKVDTYEGGVKLTLRGPVRGTFNIAGFYNDFTDQQVTVGITPIVPGSGPNAQGVVNAGTSRIYGAEVESSLELFRGLVASVSYSYLNTKIREINLPVINDPIYEITNAPMAGDPLLYATKHKLFASLDYTLPLDESIGRITIGGSYSYSSRTPANTAFRDADDRLTGLSYLQARNLFDLNMSWERIGGSNFDLSLFVNNVTKEKYYTYVLYLSSQVGLTTAQVGLPRMYGARVRYTFGR